jgi:hypothetical protein
MRQEIAQEAVKATPPVAVAGSAWFLGLTLNDIVLLATLAYIGLQAGYLVWKWFREIKRGRK